MSIYQDIMDSQQKKGYMGGSKSSGSKKSEEKRKIRYMFTLKDGKVLKSTDSNGLSDPYFRVRKEKKGLFATLVESSVQKKTLTPVWNESFEIVMTYKSVPDAVVLELLDKDAIGSDLIGTAQFYLGSSVKEHSVKFLDTNKVVVGEVNFSYDKKMVV